MPQVLHDAPAAVLVIVVNWPLGLDDGRAEARVRMAERLVQHARYLEAEQWTERALEGHPLPATVHFRVGRAFLAGRRLDAALEARARHTPISVGPASSGNLSDGGFA